MAHLLSGCTCEGRAAENPLATRAIAQSFRRAPRRSHLVRLLRGVEYGHEGQIGVGGVPPGSVWQGRSATHAAFPGGVEAVPITARHGVAHDDVCPRKAKVFVTGVTRVFVSERMPLATLVERARATQRTFADPAAELVTRKERTTYCPPPPRWLPERVKVVRKRHPFEGRSLAVLGWAHRHGAMHLVLVLPDGTRSLIPASWTDLPGVAASSTNGGQAGDATLASLAQWLRMRTVVDALLRRLPPASDASKRR